MRPHSGRSDFNAPLPHGQLDTLIDTTDETDTTVQQYQEHFGYLYDLDFRLISIGRRERGARGRSRAGGGRQGGRAERKAAEHARELCA